MILVSPTCGLDGDIFQSAAVAGKASKPKKRTVDNKKKKTHSRFDFTGFILFLNDCIKKKGIMSNFSVNSKSNFCIPGKIKLSCYWILKSQTC